MKQVDIISDNGVYCQTAYRVPDINNISLVHELYELVKELLAVYDAEDVISIARNALFIDDNGKFARPFLDVKEFIINSYISDIMR